MLLYQKFRFTFLFLNSFLNENREINKLIPNAKSKYLEFEKL